MRIPVPGPFRTAVRAHGRQLALVLVLLTCLSTVAFGGGYRASQALLDDGSAWVVKGRSVAHVNGDTGRPDAEVAKDLASGRERLEVVRTGTGVYVVNNDTGSVTTLDTATMSPEASRPGTPKSRFVAGGGRTYVVDRERGTAEELDPATLQPRGSVALPAGVQDAVADDAGMLWVLGTDGGLVAVRDRVVVTSGRAGAPGSLLTLVAGRPVVVDPEAATAVRWSSSGAERPVEVMPLRGVRPELAVPGPGPVLYLALEGTGELVAVDLDQRSVRAQSLAVTPVTDLGRPVVSRTRIAVPDFSGHRLLLLARDDLRVVERVAVPTTAATFQVVVQGDRFYATDPFRRTGVLVEPDGASRPIDKGEGHGVGEPAPATAPKPAPAAGQAPAPSPPKVALPSTPPAARVPAGIPPLSRPVAPPSPPGRPGSAQAPAAGPTPGPVARGEAAPTPKPTSMSSRNPSPTPSSTPVRPVPVPDVVGQTKEQACAELEQVQLTCRLEPTGEAGQGKPGTVVSTDPGKGSEVPPGTAVVVRHLGDTVVPTVVDLSVDAACAELTRVGLVCTRAPDGQPGAPGQKAFVVLSQSPGPGSSVPGGSSVSVAHHDKVTPDNYVGRTDADACTAISALGLRCQLDDAGSNAGRPEPLGQVVAQDPPGGSGALTPGDGSTTGNIVRVSRYTNTLRAVGTYTGGSPDAGCAAARAEGFTCAGVVRRPFRQAGVAFAQEPSAGAQAEAGAQVTVYYDDRAPNQLKRYKRDGEAVWVISSDPARGVPTGYTDQGATDLGMAYPPNVGGDGLVPITAWQCNCGGHSPNHYYTTGARPEPASAWGDSPGYAGQIYAANLMPAEMQEVHRLYRADGVVSEWAYAAAGSGEFSYYGGLGFVDNGILGYTWRR